MKISHELYNEIKSLRDKISDIKEEVDEFFLKLEPSDNKDTINFKLKQIEEYLNANLPEPHLFHCTLSLTTNKVANNSDVIISKILIEKDRSIKTIEVPVAIKNMQGSISEAEYRVVSESLNPLHNWTKLDKFTKDILKIVINFNTIKTDNVRSFVRKQVDKINTVIQKCISDVSITDTVKVSTDIIGIDIIDGKYIVDTKTKFEIYNNGQYITTLSSSYTVKFKESDKELNHATAYHKNKLHGKYLNSIQNNIHEIKLWTFVSGIIETTANQIGQLFTL